MTERRQDERAASNGRSKSSSRKKRLYPIIFTCAFFGLLFAGMLGYTCYYSYTNRMELINNSYNGRQQILLAQNTRGTIYSADGEVLAETVTDSEGNETRSYPYGKEFAHIVGYSTNGRAGVEALANYYLINTNIDLSEKVKLDASGSKYPADNVNTTLNVALQETAYKALAAYQGAIIVSNPKTGEILAMVSKPDFDPNNIEEEWSSLVSSSSNTQLLNRATQGLYPPGSTFKIVTALEYIKENSNTFNNYSFTCTGKFTLGEDSIACYHGTSHGSVNLYSSFAKSCNSSFANIGMSLDKTSFAKLLDTLMFNSELPLKLNYSKSYAYCDEDISNSDMMQLSIGQGTTSITPMHLNMITCAIANDGVLMKPYVIDSVVTADGKTVESFGSSEYKRLMSSDEAAILTELMEGVVESGTATKLKDLSYTAAGKTGSAEFNSDSDSHAWFTGFAPAEDPEICVTIIIENAGSGGEYAVPVAKRIFDTYFGV